MSEKTALSIAYDISETLTGPYEMLSIHDTNPLLAIMVYSQDGKVFEITVKERQEKPEPKPWVESVKTDPSLTVGNVAFMIHEVIYNGEENTQLEIHEDAKPPTANIILAKDGKVFEIAIRAVVDEPEREEKLKKLEVEQLKPEPMPGEVEFRDLPEADLLDIFKGAVLEGYGLTGALKDCLANPDETELADIMGRSSMHGQMRDVAKIILCDRGQISGFKDFATGKYPAVLRLEAAYALCRGPDKSQAEVAKQVLQELMESNEDGLANQARWGLFNLLGVQNEETAKCYSIPAKHD